MLKRYSIKHLFAIIFDLLIVITSYNVSFYLKFGTIDGFNQFRNNIILENIILLLVSFISIFPFRLYLIIWRYTSIKDLINIIKASTLIILFFTVITFAINRLEHLPRSVFLINWLILIAGFSSPRLLYRIYKENRIIGNEYDHIHKKISLLVFGINNSTEIFLREITRSNNSIYKIVGIIDHNNLKAHSYLYDIKIYGDYRNLENIYKQLQKKNNAPQKIIIPNDFIDGIILRELFSIADNLGMTIAKLPKLTNFETSIVDNKIEIRPIVIEDLLGRAQNSLDKSKIFDFINNKKILITGGGGTIGSELVRQINNYNPKSIIIIENSEYNLYLIDKEISDSKTKIKSIIADIRNENHIDKIFKEELPNIVFHASALKHVPLVENNIIEALSTNVIGTKIIADKSIEYNVEQMLLISTDKAVNPTSIMGITKRIAELYLKSLGNNDITRFIAVRFGNVLGSSGSVIPLFESQLKSGGPITITHPDMVRYFMTVREAVELVIQASLIAQKDNIHNSIFVLDMGEPIKIKDLAIQIIKTAGLIPDVDIEIKYTGIRPGEKLNESLFYDNEEKYNTECKSITIAKSLDINILEISETIEMINNIINFRYNEEELHNLLKNIKLYQN